MYESDIVNGIAPGSVTDWIYLIANGFVVITYLIIVNRFILRAHRYLITPPLRTLLATMISVDALTYLLDLLARFWSVFYRVNAFAHMALAIIAIVNNLDQPEGKFTSINTSLK